MKMLKSQKGVTLVALIITVIVIGIIASVTIKGINEKDSMIGVAQNTYTTVQTKSSNTQIKINALKEQE